MAEDEDEGYLDGAGDTIFGVRQTPGQSCEEEEEGEEICEGRVCAVVCILGLFLGRRSGSIFEKELEMGVAYMVVYVPEYFLGGYYQLCHFPHGLKIC